MQNEQNRIHQQQQQQQQQQFLINAQAQQQHHQQQQQPQPMVQPMHMPPHPSQFSNPSIYKTMLPTISPRSLPTAQVPPPHATAQFHQSNTNNYVVGNGQQGQILIYDKNANQNQVPG